MADVLTLQAEPDENPGEEKLSMLSIVVCHASYRSYFRCAF